MDIVYREAKINDLKNIQALNLQLFEKEYKEYDEQLNLERTFGSVGTEYYTKRILNADGYIMCAFLGQEMIGYVCGGIKKTEPYRSIEKSAELENMFVLEEHRSQGIGSKLCKLFLDWCKGQGVERVRVEASVQNIKAIEFYKKHDFLPYSLDLECSL